MKNLIDYFIERPFVVNLISVIIIIAGALSIYSLNKEMFPNVDFDTIMISTSYPGTSSEDIEKLVTIALERELKAVDGIEETNALSSEGLSLIFLKVDPDYDIDEVLQDTKDAVEMTTDIPDDAEKPIVDKLENSSQGLIRIAILNPDYFQARVVAKDLQEHLEKDIRITRVDLSGYLEEEIFIEADPKKLNRYELTIGEVATAVQGKNLNLSAGKIETSETEYIVRTVGEFSTPEEIQEIVVRSNLSGQNVKVKDVAEVYRGLEDANLIERSQGQRAVFLTVRGKPTADIIQTTEFVKTATEEFLNQEKYTETDFRMTDDLSFYVKRRLNVLTRNGFQGIILVFLCLMVFLNFRTASMTSLGAPLAFMVAFMCMDMLGITINLISMFGLILVLGMLVDDAIIVAEQFYQLVEQGMAPKQAAKKAAMDTVSPVTATILTTMVAFGALFFMGGIMGKFLWPVPAVVIICLAASWFECFFILPSHLAEYVRVKKAQANKKKWYQPLLDSYSKSLSFALKHYVVVFMGFWVLFGTSIFIAKKTRFELFPGDNVRTLFLNIKGKVGDPLNKTDAALKKVEDIVFDNVTDKVELDQFRTVVGMQFAEHGNKTGTHYASGIMYLTAPDERDRSTDEIMNIVTDKVKKALPGYTIGVKKIQGGPPRGKPAQVDLVGDNLEELQILSKKIQKLMSEKEGSKGIEIDFEDGKNQVVLSIIDAEARRLGLTTRQIAFEVRRALAGDSITEIRESDEDIDVRIRLNKESRGSIENLTNLYVLNNVGQRINLSKAVQFKKLPGAFLIRRKDRKRIITISGELDKEVTTPGKFSEEIKPALNELLKEHPTVTYSMGGENEDTQKSMDGLMKSFTIAFLCIVFILMVMFSSMAQPLIIISAIPLGLIGVIFTFYTMGLALGFMAMMGVVGLIGVVVNDSIVLVNVINKNVKKFKDREINLVIHEASLSRFRPVILTTFTTVAGLLPIAHASGGDPFLKPMALSFAYGLLFSTAVTLIFIPCTYKINMNLSGWLGRKFKKRNEEVEVPVSELKVDIVEEKNLH